MNTHGGDLLTRDAFRKTVFARDGHRCVLCPRPAVDAHHIIERRLWDDGGYYLNNGASVCGEHHMLCEMTRISVEEVRRACGIARVIVPTHLYSDQPYDKWGNPILPNGQRMKGELFFDESVQKVLVQGGMLDSFTDWVKYPRTHHLPWSEGVNKDDRIIVSLDAFVGQRVIVTRKMDGENTTLYRNHNHARSLDSRSNETRSWVKSFWSTIAQDIPPGWRVCGENLYARHSIKYADLQTYFMGFSIWTERNEALSWEDTLEWLELLGIEPVPVLYDDVFDERAIRALWNDARDRDAHEGYVVRTAGPIAYGDFRFKVAKFVRKDHPRTVAHGWHRYFERNDLADDSGRSAS